MMQEGSAKPMPLRRQGREGLVHKYKGYSPYALSFATGSPEHGILLGHTVCSH